MEWQIYASIISIIIAGIFDGFATTKRDSIPGIIEKYYANNQKFMDWWVGGNVKYNPSNIFTADYWHFLKHCLISSYCASPSFLIWMMFGFWYALVFFFIAYSSEGTTFRAVYGYIARQQPVGTFWTFIKSSVPWNGRDEK